MLEREEIERARATSKSAARTRWHYNQVDRPIPIWARIVLGSVGLLLSCSSVGLTSNPELERIVANDVLARLEAGEALWLHAGSERFLGVWRSAGTRSRGAVLILHDAGQNADWEPLIRLIRKGLASHGWNTLSIQGPLLENGATSAEYAGLDTQLFARIQTALTELKSKQPGGIAILGHGLSANALIRFVAQTSATPDALILLDADVDPDTEARTAQLEHLTKITVPVLDLTARTANPAQAAAGDERRRAQQNNAKFRQRYLEQTNHWFRGATEAVIAHIHGWLSRSLPASLTKPPQ